MMSRSACSDAPRDVAKLLRLSSWKPHCSTLVGSVAVPTSPSAADAILAPGAPKGPLSSVRPECGHSPVASPPIPARSPPTACALAADPPSGSRRSRLLVGPTGGRGLTQQGRQRAGRNVCNAKVTPAQNELGAARGAGLGIGSQRSDWKSQKPKARWWYNSVLTVQGRSRWGRMSGRLVRCLPIGWAGAGESRGGGAVLRPQGYSRSQARRGYWGM